MMCGVTCIRSGVHFGDPCGAVGAVANAGGPGGGLMCGLMYAVRPSLLSCVVT